MPRLISCQGCSRHVYATETSCPFCQRALDPAAAAELRPVPKVPSGLSRAQRFAMAAALAAPLSACPRDADDSGTPSAGSESGRGGAGSAAEGGSVAAAGSAAGSAAIGGKGGSGPAAGQPGPIAVPLYGAPLAGNRALPSDAGTPNDDDAGAPPPSDAGKPHGPVVHPLYGAPLPRQ